MYESAILALFNFVVCVVFLSVKFQMQGQIKDFITFVVAVNFDIQANNGTVPLLY